MKNSASKIQWNYRKMSNYRMSNYRGYSAYICVEQKNLLDFFLHKKKR